MLDQAVKPDDVTVVEQSGGPAGGVGGGGRGRGRLLGKFTWDNGQVQELVGAVLVGREAETDEGVLGGRLASFVPTGQTDSMSRAHAEVLPRGGGVVVLDRGSTNGTFIWDDAAKTWQRLPVGEACELRSGMVLAFGERTATFEAARP
jgi:hypothetical protein